MYTLSDSKLIDRYGRPVDVVRMTITHRCNYQCFFCHFEGEQNDDKDILTPEDFGLIAEAFSKFNVRKFKLTGGEPTVRGDLIDIVKSIKYYASPEDLSITTNGYLLKELAKDLRDAGTDRLNVSLHTLNREKYRYITGVDGLDKVLDGLMEAKNYGFKQIKVNMVILKGINEGDVWELLEFALKNEFYLQLIELHPVGKGADVFEEYHTPLSVIERKLREMSSKVIIRDLHNRPLYILNNGLKVEVVRPVKNPIFCAGCRRLRVTAKGELKPCLVRNDNLIPIIDILRSTLTREEKIRKLMEVIKVANSLREPSILWYLDSKFEHNYIKYVRAYKNCLDSFRIKDINFRRPT
ncbi:MAG TPA: GTP 3',8-cyclase MoaA [Acidilobales archaeon]|nr:GTP 3',8-cyclase MoaA [Acidilobales archaeon]